MKDRRSFLKLVNGSIWVTPTIVTISLPLHAMTSGQSFSFVMSYNEICEICDSENSMITIIEPPLEEEQNFIVLDSEIESGIFVRTIDFDGNGPVADFSSYGFTVSNGNDLRFSGTVERIDVDVPERTLRGNFEANKI